MILSDGTRTVEVGSNAHTKALIRIYPEEQYIEFLTDSVDDLARVYVNSEQLDRIVSELNRIGWVGYGNLLFNPARTQVIEVQSRYASVYYNGEFHGFYNLPDAVLDTIASRGASPESVIEVVRVASINEHGWEEDEDDDYEPRSLGG